MNKIFVVALLAATVTSLRASLLFYDPFDYPGQDGQNLSVADGTALNVAPWIHAGGATEPLVTDNGGLTYPGLQVGSDTFSLKYDGSLPTGQPGQALGSQYTSGTLYYSLLLKVTDVGAQGFGTGGSPTGGSFMAGFQTNLPSVTVSGTGGTVSTAAPLLIRSGDGTQFATTYQLGTSITPTAGDRQWYGPTFSIGPSGDTVFVVLKYDITAGSASLFINPTPGSAEPTATLQVTTGTALTLGAGLQTFFLRDNTVEPDTMLVDELRVGTTWEDVTPAVPEPSATLLGGVGALVLLLWQRYRRA